MKNLSAEQFKKQYGEIGATSFTQAPKDSSVVSRVSSSLKSSAQTAKEQITGTTDSPVTRGFELASTITGTPVKAVMSALPESVQSGLSKLGSVAYKPIEFLGNLLGNSKGLQDFVTSNPKATKVIEEIAKIAGSTAETAGNIAAIQGGVSGVKQISKGVASGVKKIPELVKPLTQKAGEVIESQPSNIMNRVARLKPNDEIKFKQLAGKTHGEYLSETGNFGAPDKILTNESIKFAKSIKSVDDSLAKLPGVYKTGAIKDALSELITKVKSVSSKNVPASYADEVKALVSKYNKGGLNMSEINQVKRLFESKVKLGYNKLLNADKVEQATNIDSALRKWQVGKAQELGFKNIKELNKQTQISKFLIDKLGNQVIGQSGLNSIGLTDWIMLSGGNPQAVAGFLTKKFFSSKAVQAKIAELLKQGEPKGQILPKITVSKKK